MSNEPHKCVNTLIQNVLIVDKTIRLLHVVLYVLHAAIRTLTEQDQGIRLGALPDLESGRLHELHNRFRLDRLGVETSRAR